MDAFIKQATNFGAKVENAEVKGLKDFPKSERPPVLPVFLSFRLMVALGMYFIQSIINFFVPSGSGQAYVTMPLMAPLADVLGITRQTAVFAFTCGDGFSNTVIPTSGILMAMLGLARVPYGRWLRFMLPLFGQLLVLALYEQYKQEGESFIPRYLEILSAGGSSCKLLSTRPPRHLWRSSYRSFQSEPGNVVRSVVLETLVSSS